MAIPPHRLRLARLQLARAQHRHNLVLAALVVQGMAGNQRRQRRWWTRPWLLRRPEYGQYETLMSELEREHHGDFRSFLRIEPEMFRELLERVGPRIEKSKE